MSIPSIFSDKGEEFFRDIETTHLKKALRSNDTVISLGGGTPCYNNNMGIIKEHSKSIFIDIPIKMLVSRLNNGRSKRPLIQNKSENELYEYVRALRLERMHFYKQADLIVNKRAEILRGILDFINTNKH